MAKSETRGGDGARGGRLVEVLKLTTAVFVLATAVLGFFTARTTQENDALQTNNEFLRDDATELDRENQALNEVISEKNSEIASLEERIAELESSPSKDGLEPTEPSTRSVNLNELDQVDGRGIRTDAVTMLGVDYRNAITMDLGTCGMIYADFPLGNQYSRFTSTVGLNDTTENAEDTWRFVVEVFDGSGKTTSYEEVMHYGQVDEVEVEVSGKSRIRLGVEEVDVDPIGGSCALQNDAATWAGPTLHP